MRLARSGGLAAIALAAVLAALPFTSAAAQVGTTSGAIRGQVLNAETGAAVSLAQVSATNRQTGFVRNAQAGEQGTFTLALLPPGEYVVTARALGFAPAELTGVRVTVGATTPVNFRLRQAAAQLETVRIAAQASEISTTQGGVSTRVSQEEIENLPTLGRDFTDFINLSGLVSPLPEVTTGGQFSIAGARPSQTNIQVDGADANNQFFGENRGGSRIPFVFSLESIREFQVITNGFDVEYGNYSGGIVNVVTKSGTNDFRATGYMNYRGRQLTARGFDDVVPRDFKAMQYALQLEGPVLKDKLHYVLSFDAQDRAEPFQPITPATLTDTAEARQLGEFFDILQNVYGVQGAAQSFDRFTTTNDAVSVFARADWTINDRHRLSIRNNFSDHDNANETFSGVIRGGLSRAEAFRDRSNSVVAELTSGLGSSAFNTLRVQYAFENRPRDANNRKPTLQVRPSGANDFSYGGNFISFNNFLGEKKLQVIDNLIVPLGAHELKFGTNNIFANLENRFWLNGSGTYTFASLEDFRNGTPATFNRNVRADGSAPTAQFSAQSYSFYAQDQWQATPRLVTTLGLRYDVDRYGDRPGRVIDVERAFGVETGNAPIDNDNLSGRLSAVFDINGNASSVLRGGAGLFYGRVPYVMGSNVAITDQPLLVVDCRGSFAEGEPTAPPDPRNYGSWSPTGADNPRGCLGGSLLTGVPEYSFWRDGFELPETWKFNVGYERRLAQSTRASLDVLWSTTSKLYTVRNLNLRDAQFTLASEGGRQVFVPAGSFNPSSGAGAARLRNTDFSDIYMNYTDGVARSLAATAEVQHRLFTDVDLRGSYTYTQAHDNSSFYCCTSTEGFRNPRVGALGPNVIGEPGDTDAAWGSEDFVRNHTFVLSGASPLPFGFQVSAFWRLQSGTPWGPEQGGDLNGDGQRFNDRPFIFRPEDLPVSVGSATGARADSIVAANRARYATYLSETPCIGEHVGQIIPRNTCRQPWFNRLDVSLRKKFRTVNEQSLQLYVDMFNVLNGINRDWGRYESVSTSARNLVTPQRYNTATGNIEYTVPTGFGDKRPLGANLLLQFSTQVGIRYSF